MIRLLLDQGVRHPVVRKARASDRAVVTLDGDFAALLALSGATRPSVVHVRIPRLSRDRLTALLAANLPVLASRLDAGCLVSVTERAIRVRPLPINSTSR